MTRQELVAEILRLKNDLRVIILGHNYQRPEVQLISDHLGDSLDLARKAISIDTPAILFCGVHFMAESAKILSPEKTVLLPEIDAGCPLADCATPEQVKHMRKTHPDAVFIAYINTSAAVKAECDVCATSANAMDIIRHYMDREIVYLPDKNLAAYAETQLGKKILRWPGQCYVHDQRIRREDVLALKTRYPDAIVMTHPETPLDILEISHVVTGTSGMLKYARETDKHSFIVVTEIGLVHRMARELPNKTFYPIETAICGQMKLTTLQSVYDALTEWKYEITVPETVAVRARIALDRMLELSA